MKSLLKTLTLTALTIALAWTCIPAFAGSDSPTPYNVTADGLTLPAGYVFEDNGHVNVRLDDDTSRNIHFEALNDQPSGHWIGTTFLPWSALNITTGCIIWVQVSQFNEHFGEGGQHPVCLTPSPEDTPDETPVPTPTEISPVGPEPVEPTVTSEPSPTHGEPSPSPTTIPDSTETRVLAVSQDSVSVEAEPAADSSTSFTPLVEEDSVTIAADAPELAETGWSGWAAAFIAAALLIAGYALRSFTKSRIK